jgi:hypothetical protein
MTFIQNIYRQVSRRAHIGTDEFSTDWLGQSRSYYTSLKARNIEASNVALINLMNKLEQQEQMMCSGNHQILKTVAKEYSALLDKVALEIAKRSVRHNMANLRVREMVLKAVEGVLESSCAAVRVHNVPAIVML